MNGKKARKLRKKIYNKNDHKDRSYQNIDGVEYSDFIRSKYQKEKSK